MKRIITLLTALCLLLSLCLPAFAADGAKASNEPVSVKIAGGTPLYKDESYSYAERAVDLVSRMTEEEMISQTEGYNSPAIARLGVATYMWWNEALHGYNQEGWFGIQTDGSSFPSSYSMGASWDPDIYYREAVQIGAEIRERVKQNRYNLTMFSPTINLGRDPRWGRNDEGYGEDPFVTGLLASSFVNGVEGKKPDGEYIRKNANGEGVKQAGTTIKHYAANNSEKNRYTSGADNVTVREMREYYTRAARIVTKNADVSSVMMAYSSVSGVPISFSSYYMDTLLRQSYGFNGYIVSDCDSVAVSYNRSVHKNNPHTNANYTLGEGFANALANGLDLQCNAGETDSLGSYASNYSQLKAEVDGSPVVTDKGYFTRQQAEVSVARLMTQRMMLGEFDADNFYATEGKARLDAGNAGEYVNGVAGQTQERIDLADDLSRATIVLLKNEGDALPIKAAEIDAVDGYDVAIVGPVGQSNFRGGYSSTLRNEANVVTIEQAIKTAFADKTFYPEATVDNVNVNYYYGFSSSVNRNSFTGLQSSQIAINDVAEDLDLAIVVVGQGNGDSREDGDRTDLNLAQAQIDLIKAVKAKNPKKLVLVMETYGPVQMVDDIVDNADAILWSGFNGFRKGTGFGEAITGKNNPSGRMNATWLKDMINDTPGFFDYSLFPSNGEGGRTYMYNVEETIYPFGYGLSYSDFAYAADGSMLGASAKDGLVIGTDAEPVTGDSTINVSFQIKNNSDVAGKQVAEVYAVSPGAGENNIPLKRLVGFDKVEVGANATVDVTIPVKVTDLAFFNEEKDCYELTPGTWKLWVAMSSDFNEATDLSEEFKIENGAIREDPSVVTVKPTQPGDEAKGISERVIFNLSKDESKNVIDPGIAVTMTNEKLYGVRVVNNVPGIDIGVDAAAATAAGNGFADPDTAASLPRLEAGKTAEELPHIGEKFTLPDTYKIEFSSNRPEVVQVADAAANEFAEGQLVMKGQGVATIKAKVTGPSGVSAEEVFTVCVKAEPGLESISIGETEFKKFEADNYDVEVTVPRGTLPSNPGLVVNATAVEGANVEYLSKAADGSFVANESRTPETLPGTVYVRVTGDDLIEQIYTVNYKVNEAPINTAGMNSDLINFADPADNGRYEIVGQTSAEQTEDGLPLVTTTSGIEPGNGRLSGDAANTPVDLVKVPVEGDWVADLEVVFNTNGARNGYYQFFGFYAAQGDDYQNLAGIRGGDGALQDFLRVGGEITADTDLKSTPGFNADGKTYYLRIEKIDDSYYCYRSDDGKSYTQMFSFVGTGINADKLVIDAYTGMTEGYKFTLKTLNLLTPGAGGGPNIDFTDPADEPKYEVVGQNTYALEEGTGVKLTPTAFAFEPVTAGCGGSAEESEPQDLIKVPVVGDWTAVLNLSYNPNDAATASSTFYALVAAQGDDYKNMAGIRGTGTQIQDFLREDGAIADPVAPGNGFTDAGLYWIKLQKDGTNYTASISTDGEEYTEVFTMEDTGIEAEYLLIDAYKTSSSTWGSTAVWDITLKSLYFGEQSEPGPVLDKTGLNQAIAAAEAIDKSEYTADSVAALETALANAKAARKATTQEAIDEATQALNDAIAALVKEDKADTSGLEAAIARAEAVERDKYTDESLAAMDAALAEARTALAESRLQAVIDTAAQALNDAVDALVEKETPPPPSGEWKVVDAIEAGGTYVIVADDAYALNNKEVPGLATYASSSTTMGATPVTIEGGKITSAVDDTMLWTFTDASASLTAYDEQAVYFIQDVSGKYLQRGSMSQQNSGLILNASLNATMRYNTWSAKAYDITVQAAEDGTSFCLYINSEREYGRDYAARVHGGADGFDIPSPLSQRDPADPFAFMNSENTSKIKFYAQGVEPLDTGALEAAIANAENLDEAAYEAEGFAAVQEALTAAKAALDSAKTQDEVDAAAKALNQAVAKLVPKDGMVGLKDAFAEYFKIGTCLSQSEVNKAEGRAFTLKHFNSVTCENEMKPEAVLDQAGSQAAGDNITVKVQLPTRTRAILDFCQENHIPMRGHVFCWHSQTPAWLFNENFDSNGATVSQEIMDKRLESYIKNYFEILATEYPDLEFYSFDVVNEAFTDSNPSGMRASNQSGWIRVYGDDTFIYRAFEYAHKYKPEGCLLAYNDYNEYNDGKVDSIYALAKNLYEKGWLDAVGMQSHLELPSNPTIERYRNALAKFASIGCKIMVTELDVQNNNDAQQLADYYQQLFETYIDYKDQIEAVVFWGNNDGVSWRSNRNPLLFDRNYEPKAAYYSVLDAISDHEHEFEEKTVQPTCTADGYVADVCKICGRTVVRQILPALGHDWDEGVVTKEPTETEPGVRTFTCQRCGETKLQRIRPTGATLPADIDFTIPADAEKFEVIGKESGDIVEGVGLSLVTSQGGVEPAKQNIAETPHDVIEVPVDGDWTATLEFVFETNGAANGYYQFFGFYGATDYNNMVGIRGGDGALQDFIRKEGAITEETKASSPGLSNNGATYWFRLEKSGDTYTAYRSSDGEEFTQMFDYTETGIEAEKIVIDAYTGMTTGYKFTLKSLTFDEPGAVIVNKNKLDKAITDAEAIDKNAYTAESVAALEAAVEAAKAVQADDAATQEAVNAAAKAVNDAIEALVPVVPPVDKTNLDTAISAAEALKADDYTPESYAALQAALEDAKAVQAKEDATQAEVDAAAAAVNKAIDDLQAAAGKVDPKELVKAIAAAEAVDPGKYTEDSVKALNEALEAAKAVQAKEDATQAEVDKAAEDLNAAIEALEEKPDDFLFEDVKDPAKFYFDPVYWAFKADPQITNGVDKTHFGPDNACTRGHVVTFLWRAAGCPEPKSTTTPFKDLKPGAFYEKAVAWAVENEITNGVSADKFAPDAECNRGQIVTFLWRFKGKPDPKSAETPFKDLKDGAFYLKAVAWAVENEITNGMSADRFAPDNTCTRGQVVTFLYRATKD